jgi:hypothetical protein
MEILLSTDRHVLKAGDLIAFARRTPARRALTRYSCNWGEFRRYMVFVKAVKGRHRTRQPLRIDFPAADEGRPQDRPDKDCGVEGLGFEQTTTSGRTPSRSPTPSTAGQGRQGRQMRKEPRLLRLGLQVCSIEDCVSTTPVQGRRRNRLRRLGARLRLSHGSRRDLQDAARSLFQWSASGNVVRTESSTTATPVAFRLDQREPRRELA